MFVQEQYVKETLIFKSPPPFPVSGPLACYGYCRKESSHLFTGFPWHLPLCRNFITFSERRGIPSDHILSMCSFIACIVLFFACYFINASLYK